jgi:hypothetical protein
MANIGPEKRTRIVKPEKPPVPQRIETPAEPQKVPQEQPVPQHA